MKTRKPEHHQHPHNGASSAAPQLSGDYVKPELTRYGKVADLTAGGFSGKVESSMQTNNTMRLMP